MKQQLKQVSLVGKANGYEKSFIKEGDIWCTSSVFNCLSSAKVDLIFNLHEPDTWEKWLPEYKEKVITAFPSVHAYQQYPVRQMLDKYGPVFGSTGAWMLALATICGKYDRIKFFGFGMASKQEYIDQRDTLFYWIGRAEERGIEVIIPEDSRIFFKDRIYGVLKDGEE